MDRLTMHQKGPHQGCNYDSYVEQLVRVEHEVKGARLPPLRNPSGVHHSARLHASMVSMTRSAQS